MSCSAITAGFLDLCNDGPLVELKKYLSRMVLFNQSQRSAGNITAITVGGARFNSF